MLSGDLLDVVVSASFHSLTTLKYVRGFNDYWSVECGVGVADTGSSR
jgi:hypothetical protein